MLTASTRGSEKIVSGVAADDDLSTVISVLISNSSVTVGGFSRCAPKAEGVEGDFSELSLETPQADCFVEVPFPRQEAGGWLVG